MQRRWSRFAAFLREKVFVVTPMVLVNASERIAVFRALAVESRENWIEAMQYLNMEPLAEQKKAALRRMGVAAYKVSTRMTKGRGLNRRPLPLDPIPA